MNDLINLEVDLLNNKQEWTFLIELTLKRINLRESNNNIYWKDNVKRIKFVLNGKLLPELLIVNKITKMKWWTIQVTRCIYSYSINGNELNVMKMLSIVVDLVKTTVKWKIVKSFFKN